MIYLISSPYRVGSHYLQSIINSTGNQVIKTHDPKILVDYENTCLIIVNRKNKFAAIMSMLVAGYTNSWHGEVKELPTFLCTVSKEELLKNYQINKYYHLLHDLSKPWAKVERFYFEDFLNNPTYVFESLNLVNSQRILYPEKSKYRHQDIVANIDECKKWFLEFEDHTPKILIEEKLYGLLPKSN
jgi:hypothetical protein